MKKIVAIFFGVVLIISATSVLASDTGTVEDNRAEAECDAESNANQSEESELIYPFLSEVPLSVKGAGESDIFIDSGTCGNAVQWALEQNGVLTISGSGEMYSYSPSGQLPPWSDYSSQIISVSIQKGVTSIGDYAFYGLTNLKAVDFPDGFKCINSGAFVDCISLSEIILPDSATTIRGWVFQGCSALSEVRLPMGISNISASLFSECTSLTEIFIPTSVKEISKSAFYHTGLKHIDIPSGVEKIDWGAFQSCESLQSISIPGTVTYLGDMFVGYCPALTSINIPESVSVMGNHCFVSCTALKEITLPKTVNQFGFQMFENCSNLKSVTIPSGFSVLQKESFFNCTALQSVYLPVDITVIGNNSFKNCPTLREVYFKGSTVQWNAVEIQDNNDALNTCNIICNDITPISKATISGISNQRYTGKAITPNPTVKLGTIILKNGTDYTLSYKNNKMLGTATITITGKGKYSGTATKTFRVVLSGTYTIGSAVNKNYVMDVAGANKKNGANIQLYKSNKSNAQKFTITAVGNYYKLINKASGKALDVKGGKVKNKQNVQSYKYNGTKAQLWMAKMNSDGTIIFISAVNKNYVLDLAGGRVGNKKNIQIYKTNGTKAQRWILTPA